MDFLISSTAAGKVDEYTINTIGIPSMVLMERAAYAVSSFIVNMSSEIKNSRVLCLCGMGNNGADGIAVARQLNQAGIYAEAVYAGDEKKATQQWIKQRDIALNCAVTVRPYETYDTEGDKSHEGWDFIVDAIFGIGLKRNLEGIYKKIVDDVNTYRRSKNAGKCKIIAVDIPSGLNGDKGIIMGAAIKADYTVTFGKKKLGMCLCDGPDCTGKVLVEDVGFPRKSYEEVLDMQDRYFVLDRTVLELLNSRKKHTNKGSYGKVLIIAGSENMYGAAYFSAKSALNSGAGLVRILTHRVNRELLYGRLPEVIIECYDTHEKTEEMVENAVKWADTVVTGPGLSTSDMAATLTKLALQFTKKYGKRVIVDADSINVIAANDYMIDLYHSGVVITPHIGEAARLMKKEPKKIAEDIVAFGRDYSVKYGITVVLKDASTVVFGIESLGDKCNNMIYVNTSGNPGMATGGSGDVLTGILAAILSGSIDAGKEIFFATALGVYVHGVAGDMAAKRIGEVSLTPSDIIENLPGVWSDRSEFPVEY